MNELEQIQREEAELQEKKTNRKKVGEVCLPQRCVPYVVWKGIWVFNVPSLMGAGQRRREMVSFEE